MAVWQRPVRVGLASFALTFAVTLLYNMSDRRPPPSGSAVAAADPTAVLESRGAHITLGDGSVIVADRQFAYDDGSARLLGVEVIVPAGEEGTDFRIRSGEAAGVERTEEWRLADAVTIETGDGLSGTTSEASYAGATGLVTMPEPARFEQSGMRLEGDAARYDRPRGVLRLEQRAVVELRPNADGDDTRTRITATTAEVDRAAGVMHFAEGASIDAGGRWMQADRVDLRFEPEASRIDAIELAGSARVLGGEAAGSDVREMSAQTIAVTYREGELESATLAGDARLQGADTAPGRPRDLSAPTIDVAYRGGGLERMTMTGGGQVELFGDRPGGAGLTIDAGFVEMTLRAESADIDALRAREGVTLAFPAEGGNRRRIRSQALDIGGGSEETAAGQGESSGGLAAVFDGNVEMRESRVGRPTSAQDDRVMRADRLEAVLRGGLARLAEARFLGSVTLAAESIRARADQATYAPAEALFTLAMSAAGLAPRMDDERGFVQARRISIDLDGPNIEATAEVKGVLSETEASDATSAVRPALFAAGDPVHFVAGLFSYDAEDSLATYGGGARLWQGGTEFRGGRVVVDETTGNITAEQAVQTRTTMLQHDEALSEAVETVTVGRGATLFYDNRERRVTYAGRATLTSPGSTFGGDTIELFLHEDARTLDRIRIAGNVTLELDTRSVTAATLTYDDREGRYDLTGRPVSVIERTAGECRETTGQVVSFYSTGDSITADGQSAERTASTGGRCAPGTTRDAPSAAWPSSRRSR